MWLFRVFCRARRTPHQQAAKLWQGVNLPLALSALTLLLGFVLYRVYPRLLVGWQRNDTRVANGRIHFRQNHG